MVRKTSGAEEEGRCFLATRHDNAEISPCQVSIQLFLWGHGHQLAAEILDYCPFFDGKAGSYRRFMCDNGVAIGGGHLERAIWHPDVDVLAQVSSEVFFLAVGGETVIVLADPGKF